MKHFYLILIITFLPKFYFGNTAIFNGEEKVKDISEYITYFEDTTGQLSFVEIVNKEFLSPTNKVANFGFSKSTYWIKIPVINHTENDELLISIELPTLDYIKLYDSTSNNLNQHNVLGEYYEFKKRNYSDPYYLFKVKIEPKKEKLLYFEIKAKEGIQVPVKIGKENDIISVLKTRDLLSGIFIGTMLVMILYNFFIYIVVKDSNYLLYIIYIILTLLTQASLQNYTFQFLWPKNPIISQYSLFIFPALTGITGLIFMLSFLKTFTFFPKISKISFLLIIVNLISILLGFLKFYKISQEVLQINSGIISIYMLTVSILIVRKKFEPARFFLIAWLIFLLGVIGFILKDFEVLPFNNFTRYTMQIGSGIETVLLSFALAARINVYKKERLEALEEKERIVREQNIMLEEKVKERTKELNEALTNLKQTQSQLVDAEKMSSLGQLTAGIAHEINNPINFVSSSISPLRRDIKDIENIIKKYEEITTSENLEEKLKEIEILKKEIDYEYLKTELETIINSIEDGAERTKEIVSSLRNFSRLDEVELQKSNINEGIESTLVLLKSKLNRIKVQKDLKSLPLIECYPSKLNQIFMNIIDNAIGAIKDKGLKAEEGVIEINTYHDEQHVYITIKDNGIGMNEKIKDKIFEPFFTTKDVGKGTGLGLSIVYSIIESHNGEISVESSKNEGTQFMIKIPNKG